MPRLLNSTLSCTHNRKAFEMFEKPTKSVRKVFEKATKGAQRRCTGRCRGAHSRLYARTLYSCTLKPFRRGSHHSPHSSGRDGIYSNLKRVRVRQCMSVRVPATRYSKQEYLNTCVPYLFPTRPPHRRTPAVDPCKRATRHT
jgi:hypothetical protein